METFGDMGYYETDRRFAKLRTYPGSKCGCLVLTRLHHEYELRKITLRSIGTKVLTITQFVSISNHEEVMNPAFAFLFSLNDPLRAVSGPNHKYRTRYHPWTTMNYKGSLVFLHHQLNAA